MNLYHGTVKTTMMQILTKPTKETTVAKKLNKINKVNESFTVYRYDNGFMIEVGGRDKENDYKTAKVMCATDTELFEVIKEALSMELDD